jgi:hypothetical protein
MAKSALDLIEHLMQPLDKAASQAIAKLAGTL